MSLRTISLNETGFNYRRKELYCDAIAVRKIVEAVGTPVYVYSARRIAARFAEFNRTLGDLPHLSSMQL